MVYKGCMVWTLSSRAASLIILTYTMSSLSNSSPSHPGRLNSQQFHWVFPYALPCRQHNILYTTVLQQPCLVAKLECQSAYEENNSIQSLVHVFHHLCSMQIYLGTLEPHTDHIVPSTLHIVSTLEDILDLLHDNGFYHFVLALLPNNITLTHIFRPIYCTSMAVERDAYEESDLRLVHHISTLLPLPIPTPCAPSPALSLETPALSPLSIATTLIDTPTDTHPAFHQDHTTSYPTWVIPRHPCLGPPMETTLETVCFHCHVFRHLCVDCPDYECPNCHQHALGHPQYRCLHNFCSFCQPFSHMPRYCLDQQCALCNDPGHVVTDCPFLEDPSSGVIFNDGGPKGIWSCPGGTSLQRGYCYSMRTCYGMRTGFHLFCYTLGSITSWLAAHVYCLHYLFYRHLSVYHLVTSSLPCVLTFYYFLLWWMLHS